MASTPNCLRHAMQALRRPSPWTASLLRPSLRAYATEVAPAAPEIDFSAFHARPARIVPTSPAYFSGSPKFIDHLLNLEHILAKHAALPTVAPADAPRMAWFKLPQFRDFVGEPVPTKKYKSLIKLLQRLNRIDPALVPAEVRETLKSFLRPGNPYGNKPAPRTVDEMGRARGAGKRKTSSAVVHLVEGEGEVRVNGKSLVEAFPRLHDRESATWPLRCTSRLDKYNVWATVSGGGVTGQAEAVTLALARALLVHEPALKPLLRKCKSPYLLSVPVELGWGWCQGDDPFGRKYANEWRVQLVRLRWTPVAWRERSRAMSRRARCPPGSSGEHGCRMAGFVSFFFLPFGSFLPGSLLYAYGVLCFNASLPPLSRFFFPPGPPV